MARFRRYLFNRSNLFVAFLVIVTGINVFLSTNTQPVASGINTTLLRVEEINKDNFNNIRLLVSDDNGYWVVPNFKGDKPQLGKEVVADVEYKDFSPDDKYTTYNLGKGYKGVVDIKRILAVKTCDLACKYINTIHGVKNYIDSTFLHLSCNSERWLTSFLAPDVSCLDIANLSKGLLVGDVSFTQRAKEIFRKTGINHLVAVSGFQVVLISSFLEWFLLKARLRRLVRVGIVVVFIVGFLTLVGPQPPILRSVLSIIISFFVLLIGRKVPQNKVLIYSGLLLLWYNPFLIFSISFQLSYLASFALINSVYLPVYLPNEIETNSIISERLLNVIKTVSGYIFANVSIFLYTLPIIVSLNGYVSIWSILINLLLVPFIPIVSLLNIFALIPFVGSYINLFPLGFESILLQFLYNQFLNFEPLKLSLFGPLELAIYYIVLVVCNTLVKYYIENREYQSLKEKLQN
jgi:competence protein ComEC